MHTYMPHIDACIQTYMDIWTHLDDPHLLSLFHTYMHIYAYLYAEYRSTYTYIHPDMIAMHTDMPHTSVHLDLHTYVPHIPKSVYVYIYACI